MKTIINRFICIFLATFLLSNSHSVLAQIVIDADDLPDSTDTVTLFYTEGEGEIKNQYSGTIFDMRSFPFQVFGNFPGGSSLTFITRSLPLPIQLGSSGHLILLEGEGFKTELFYNADGEGTLITPLQEITALRVDFLFQGTVLDSVEDELQGYIFLTKNNTAAELMQSDDSSYSLFINDWQSPNISFHNTYGEFKKNPIKLLRQSLKGTEKDTAKICADGSDVTLISIRGSVPGVAMEDVWLNFKGNTAGENEAEFGLFSLHEVFANEDSVVFRYTHPRIVTADAPFRDLILQVVDKNDPSTAIYEQPVHIYRAPIVLVHGLWGGMDSFEEMKNKLAESNLWPEDLIYIVHYKPKADAYFSIGWPIVKSNISRAIERLIEKKFSVGRTNVVAHSMGGILTRLFIQSDTYDNQIARFITLNSPHAGSQWANYLLEDPCGQAITQILDNNKHYTRRGAINDLRVNSHAILVDLNGAGNLNKNIVPSHAIVTTANITDPSDLESWPYLLVRRTHRLIYLALRAGEAGLEQIEELVDAIFNGEENDIIVAASSQTGGLSHVTSFAGTWHVGAQENSEIIQQVRMLLNEDPLDESFFSRFGFNPQPLTYNFDGSLLEDICDELNKPQPLTLNTANSDSLKIISPMPEIVVRPGETITVTFSGAEKFPGVMFTASTNQIGIFSNLDETASGVFTYIVPERVIGRIHLAVTAFSKETKFTSDAVFINIQPTSEVNSISIVQDYIVLSDGIFPISVIGHFADGISRDITETSELVLEVEDESIAVFNEEMVLEPISPGETKIIATYKGKAAEAIVKIRAQRNPTSVNSQDIENDSENTAMPEGFALDHNHPNPFNASTTISYTLKKDSSVRLTIYNVKGQMVARLVNRKESAGEHKIVWLGLGENGTAVPSGIYFYELQVGESNKAVKKMVLLK